MNDRVTLARLWAAVLIILGFLPFANWIDGGHVILSYRLYSTGWLSGSAIALGLALVLFIVVRRFDWWPMGWARIATWANQRHLLTSVVLAVVALSVYASVARLVLSSRSLNIDEVVQVMQARIFASGKLSIPADAYPEFFSALNVVDVNGAVFSQFPPGGPLMLLPGEIAGLTWLTGPLFGMIAVVAFWRLARATEPAGIAIGAALLFSLAPFMAFMSGSHMNHVTTLAWLCLALVCLRHVTGEDRHRPLSALGLGLCLGMMISIRPMDGAVFALPAGLWLLLRTIRRQTSLATLLASGAGIALPVLGVLAFNRATTGDALLFGYELLWGASHDIGFHQPPWGVRHTPVRGFELINMYFVRMQGYLYETPLPSLVPVIGALSLTRRLTSLDRYLLVSGLLLVLGYFAYWHDGHYLGPRFFFLLLPLLVLWTARLPAILRERYGVPAERFVLLVYAVSAAVAVFVSIPFRARQYANGLASMRHDYVAPADAASVTNALIMVRESWGAQLIARLWALGVPRSVAEGLYRTVDTCLLEGRIAELEATTLRQDEATKRLLPLTADSLRLVESPYSPDQTQLMLPGIVYGPTCERRLREDQGGFVVFAPLLARDPGSNIYARDLHARDTVLLQRYPNRPVYLLRSATSRIGAPLVLERVKLDSARAEWALVAGQGR